MKNEKKPLISVIIPVYKAEKYLEKCIKSVLTQTYENLEVLLIDDGSPDKSGGICDAFAKTDKRIRVIHKENGGAATARNAGLDVMTGEYVAFVDADDYMKENYLETLYEMLITHDAQAALCGFQIVDENGGNTSIDTLHSENEWYESQKSNKVETLTGNQIILQDLQGHWEHVAPWGKLFQAELYRHIRYPKWFAHEDEPVFIEVFNQVEKVVVSTEPLYYYVQHTGSLMNTAYSEKDRTTYLQMWRERIKYYSDNTPKHKQLYNCVCQAYVAWLVLYLSRNAVQMTKEQQRELKRELKKEMGCLLKTPHLFSLNDSMKLLIKCVLTLINTNILGKRYTK